MWIVVCFDFSKCSIAGRAREGTFVVYTPFSIGEAYKGIVDFYIEICLLEIINSKVFNYKL